MKRLLISLLTISILVSCNSEKDNEIADNDMFYPDYESIDYNTKSGELLNELEGHYIFLEKIKKKFVRVSPCGDIDFEFYISNFIEDSTTSWSFKEQAISELEENEIEPSSFHVFEVNSIDNELLIKGQYQENLGYDSFTTIKIIKTINNKVWSLDVSGRSEKSYITLKENTTQFKLKSCFDARLILMDIPLKYTNLTKMEEGEHSGELVFYEECHYGPSYISIEENGDYISFSGGGDQVSPSIVSIEKIKDVVTITYRDDYTEETQQLKIEDVYGSVSTITGESNWIISADYASNQSAGEFATVSEPCDE